eukprot:TRINITY_DN19693_c0_g1_i1.p1 TRINITY_DN19693_c0_g1~~TRINITY_DN19693_c0_g1_i1.p1  ORF type:complete len:189 (-),score=50.40 TRINITY_DN19693_c0_g1_i1:15-581(-)
MFQCRICSENPFTVLFGDDAPPKDDKKSKKKEKAAAKRASASSSSSRRDEINFEPRNEEEIRATLDEWIKYAHPRARDFFATSAAMEEVLLQLAKGINKHDDPILGPDDQCCHWYGDVTKEDQEAAIRMVKPGEPQESITYVNRVLAFIFATDESFEQLMRLPKEPFKMSCGNQLCVHLAHISLETSA